MIYRVPIALTGGTKESKAIFMIIGETHTFNSLEKDAETTMEESAKAVAGILSKTSTAFRRELMKELKNLYPKGDELGTFNNRIDEYRKHALNYAVNQEENDDDN